MGIHIPKTRIVIFFIFYLYFFINFTKVTMIPHLILSNYPKYNFFILHIHPPIFSLSVWFVALPLSLSSSTRLLDRYHCGEYCSSMPRFSLIHRIFYVLDLLWYLNFDNLFGKYAWPRLQFWEPTSITHCSLSCIVYFWDKCILLELLF